MIPHDMEMCMWFFQDFTEIQNGRHAWTSTFFVQAKTQKLKSEIMCRWFYWNLNWLPQVDFLNICDVISKAGTVATWMKGGLVIDSDASLSSDEENSVGKKVKGVHWLRTSAQWNRWGLIYIVFCVWKVTVKIYSKKLLYFTRIMFCITSM